MSGSHFTEPLHGVPREQVPPDADDAAIARPAAAAAVR